MLAFLWYSGTLVVSNRTPDRMPPVVTARIGTAATFLLPDRGEARRDRQEHIDAVVETLRRDALSAQALADALLARAKVCQDLEKQAAAQQAVVEVQQLFPSAADWRHREALVLADRLRDWEESDAKEKQLLRDAREQRIAALSLHAAGDYLAAVSEARQAVAVSRRRSSERAESSFHLGRQSQLADDLLLLGRLMREHSDTYLQAPGLLEEAYAVSVESRGEMHPISAEMLKALAFVEDNRGEFESANAKYNRALDIIRQTQGELSLEFARTLAQQGRMHLEWWEDYASGKGYRALQICEQLLGSEHPECAESLEHLGMHALWLTDLPKAKLLLQKAIELREQTYGSDHPETTEALNWLAQVHLESGDLAQAHLMARRALAITEKHRGHFHPRLIRYLSNIAVLGVHDWNQPRGEREARRALDIAARMGLTRHPSVFEARFLLVHLIGEEESPYGIANLQRINVSIAADFARESLAVFEAVPRSQRLPAYAGSLCALAHFGYWDNYTSVSRDEARQALDVALKNLNANGGELHLVYSDYLWARGRWHCWARDYQEGFKYLSSFRDWVETKFGTVLTERRAGGWRVMSGFYMHQGIPSQEMADCLQRAAKLDEEIFRRNAAGQSDVDRHSMGRARYFTVGACLTHPASGLAHEEIYRQLLLAKGAISSLQLYERTVRGRAEYQQSLAALAEARQRFKQIAYDIPSDSKQRIVWRDRLFQAADDKEFLERELAFATRGSTPSLEMIDPGRLQSAIPKDTVLLDFLAYTEMKSPEGNGQIKRDRRLGVFVVRRDRPVAFVDLASSETVLDSVFAWRESFHGKAKADKLSQHLADHVTELVWRPLEPYLIGANVALIAPDGPACFIPFAALSGRSPGRYVIEDLTIAYITSAQQWTDLLDRPDSPTGGDLLVVGDIDYQDDLSYQQTVAAQLRDGKLTGHRVWESLPATRLEVDAIKNLYAQSKQSVSAVELLSGKAPTVQALLTALSRRPKYVHFAGHGFFASWKADLNPVSAAMDFQSRLDRITDDETIVFGRAPLLLSGLVLAPDGSSQDTADSILTAEEVAGLDLRGTEMVVLSACETALGNTIGGEGILGLQRAFLNAGANSTMTSLWKVDDEGTSILMEHFYRYLWRDNLPKWEALRRAQLDVLNNPELIPQQWDLLVSRGLKTGQTRPIDDQQYAANSSQRRTSPFFWAAFVLYGDGR